MRTAGSVASAIDAPWVSSVDVEYFDERGEPATAPIGTASQIQFEVLPTRLVASSFKGRRAFSGLWWCATTRSHVMFGSWLARDHLIALDFDPAVVGIAYRPVSLRWRENGGDRRYVPDYFVRLRDGTAVLIDVRSPGRAGADLPPAVAEAVEGVGWDRSCVGPLDAVLAANLRWLAGYRHLRCGAVADVRAVRTAFACSRPLADGIAEIGDPLSARPAVFHLLWTGVLSADLSAALLTDDSLVVVAAGADSS